MTAFRATYSDLKLIKTRKVVQIIFEIPQEDFDAAYEVLGGLPNPAAERWFGIAALKEVMPDRESTPAERPRPDKTGGATRDWRDLSPVEQAGIRCEGKDSAIFAAFLKERWPDEYLEGLGDSAVIVRHLCRISSRSELATNNMAQGLWHQIDDQYQAWKAVEHA